MPDWSALFVPTAPVLELLIRGTVTYVVLFALLRVVGQREAGGLGMSDLLVVVLIADAASAGLRGDSESIGDGLILVATILFWSVAVDLIAYRWPKLTNAIKGRPRPLIKDGELNRHAMRRELMTTGEVLSQLRLHGIEDVRDVHLAYLEPSGMISVIRVDGDEPDVPPKPPT